MQEQFRAVQQAREKRKQEEDKLTEKIRERIKQLNEMHTIVSGIVSEMPIEMDTSQISIQMQVEEVAFTTCRICEFPVVWGTSPPTNCVFCCANMKFY
jgi:hypothetical protein